MSDRDIQDGGGESTTAAAKEEASRLGEEVKREAGQVTDEVKKQGRELLSETQERLRQEAIHQSERAASGLRSMSGDLRSMADSSDAPSSNVTQWVRRGADEIDSFAGRLDHDGFEGVMRDVSGFAKKNPTTFLVSTFSIGFLAGRVLKNREADPSMQNNDPYRSEQTGSFGSKAMQPPTARTAAPNIDQRGAVATESLSQ